MVVGLGEKMARTISKTTEPVTMSLTPRARSASKLKLMFWSSEMGSGCGRDCGRASSILRSLLLFWVSPLSIILVVSLSNNSLGRGDEPPNIIGNNPVVLSKSAATSSDVEFVFLGVTDGV